MGLDHSKVKSYVHNSLNKQERFNIDSIRNFQLNKTIEPWVKLNLFMQFNVLIIYTFIET